MTTDDRPDHPRAGEIQRAMDAALHRTFFMAHTYGDVLEGPWGWEPSDGTAMSGSPTKMAELINGSAPWADLIVTEGASDD